MKRTYPKKNSDSAIQAIVHLPITFSDPLNNESAIKIIDTASHELLDKDNLEQDIVSLLRKNQDKTSAWLQWSEDKRVNKGWFFSKENNEFIVGFFDQTHVIKSELFNDEIEACASFIVKEVESILK